MKFGCAICIFLNSENLICRSTDILKCFRGSLQLRDNESRLYIFSFSMFSKALPYIVKTKNALNLLSQSIEIICGVQWCNGAVVMFLTDDQRDLSLIPRLFAL